MRKMFFPIIVAGMPQSGSTLLYNIILNILHCAGYENIIGGAPAGIAVDKLSSIIIVQETPVVFKVHRRDLNSEVILQNKDTKVFTARRDLRDCIASNVRRKEMENAADSDHYLDQLREWINSQDAYNDASFRAATRSHYIKAQTIDVLKAYSDWEDRSNFEFIYEHYKNGGDQERNFLILKIAETIKCEITETMARKILYTVEELIPSRALQFETVDDEGLVPANVASACLMTKYHVTNKGIVGGYKDTLHLYEIEAIEEIAGDWLREHGYMK